MNIKKKFEEIKNNKNEPRICDSLFEHLINEQQQKQQWRHRRRRLVSRNPSFDKNFVEIYFRCIIVFRLLLPKAPQPNTESLIKIWIIALYNGIIACVVVSRGLWSDCSSFEYVSEIMVECFQGVGALIFRSFSVRFVYYHIKNNLSKNELRSSY